jgi:hypothetical protein
MLSDEDQSFSTEGADEMPFEKSCDIGWGALKVGFGGSNRSRAFVPLSPTVMFSLTSLFTLGLGITGEACMNFSTQLIFVAGAGLCSSTACECENLTTPKIVSTTRCTAIETAHAQNVTLPLRQVADAPKLWRRSVETIPCFILFHNFHL